MILIICRNRWFIQLVNLMKNLYLNIALYSLKQVFLTLLWYSVYPWAYLVYFQKVWTIWQNVVQMILIGKIGAFVFYALEHLSRSSARKQRLLLKERLCVTEDIWGEYISCFEYKISLVNSKRNAGLSTRSL